MSDGIVSLVSFAELTAYVHERLCEHDQLDPQQSPLQKSPLVKRGKACGMLFHTIGPREIRSSAVWSSEEMRILFYDSAGTRVQQVRLSESPDLAELGVK